jgi:hypothetical protein
MFLFGTGFFYATPTKDANGNAIVVPTPIKLGTLQDVSLDVSFETKSLYGQAQFPVAQGRGKGKISGKAKFAGWNSATLNSLIFGQTLAAGILFDYNDQTGAAIPTTPFTITPVAPSSGTWAYDLGVIDANGIPMTRVASAPAVGQYSVTAGAYLFNTGDTGKTVFINYSYTASSTSAQKSTVMNLAMGYAPTFQCDINFPYDGKQMKVWVANAIASKVTIASKQDDFIIAEFDFEGFANAAGQVIKYGTSE